MDLVGPWKITIEGMGDVVINALTMIDIASTLCEIIRIDNKTSEHISMHFVNEWLSRYPKPSRVIFDQGKEFTGRAFQSMLIQNGIKPVPTTVKNPQANAVVERLHLTIGDQIRSQAHGNPPTNVETAVEYADTILKSAQYAMRTAVHTTLNVSPGAMIFGRDMMLPVPIVTDFNVIRMRRQAVIDEANRKENLRRRYRDYEVGDEVMIQVFDPKKGEERNIGPFVIEQVHVNGNVTIRRNDVVYERINIRRLVPYNRV